jgi:pimeloyl-ACP methyl ester carboxylesterase
MTSTLEQLDRYRSQVPTRSGPASYVDTGGPGRTALFVHGVGTSSYLWRHVIGQLVGQRRCVAVDLPLHGQTPAAAGQDFSLPGLARFLADCCDALELTGIDLVANDTGGAISQVFAAGHPERLRTLTLTNCEAHNNVPPKALLPGVLLARMGLFARIAPRLVRDIPRARRRIYGPGYQDVTRLPEDIVRAWVHPLFGTREAARQSQRLMVSLRARDLLAAEPSLGRLQVPTLIVWGTGDRFFRRKWAYWLRDTIPGATGVIELDGARLFFPDERSAELTAALRRHWDAHPGTGPSQVPADGANLGGGPGPDH